MFSAVFHDYDAYAEAIARVDARFMLQKLEQRCWEIGGLALPGGITIQHCWSGSGAIAHGTGASGGVEFAIPAAGHFVANGEKVPADGALLIAPNEEFVVSIPGLHRWFNVFVPEALLHACGMPGEDEWGLAAGVRSNRAAPSAPAARLLVRFLSSCKASPAVAASEQALWGFQADLLMALQKAYGPRRQSGGRHRGRERIVDKALVSLAVEAIENTNNRKLPMAELLDRFEVSERSLRAGFHRYLGMSPSQFMQLDKLNRAWQQLSRCEPESTTVARVAADLGLWDQGRFAMRYRRQFGEPPSATLRRPGGYCI